MEGFQAFFKRREIKYLLSSAQYDGLYGGLTAFLCPTQYGVHTIRSLYFDTDTLHIARLSADKPPYKEKFRLRSYGPAGGNDLVFAELKKKAEGVVYKRRIALPYREAEELCRSGRLCAGEAGGQIAREIEWFFHRWNPRPVMMLCYERLALERKTGAGAEDGLRITFDFDIRRRPGGEPDFGDTSGVPLFTPGQHCLMEIKTASAVPVEVAALLSRYGVYPVSFSKYTRAWQNAGENMQLTGGTHYVG